MRRLELFSRILVTAGIVLAVGAPLLWWRNTPLIHARMADSGGWNPDVLQAKVGQPLELRLTSDDVRHGFAVGQMDVEPVDVEPGKVTEVTLTFSEPGIYTFFCTHWCGVNHWRMRGTIEATGPATEHQAAPAIPLYITLGIDIDAPHESPVLPETQPSAVRGQHFARGLAIEEFTKSDTYRATSPYQVFEALDSTNLTDSERWDVVAYIWQSNTTTKALTNGKELYTQNCAACHGENGAGDGIFADDIAKAGETSIEPMSGSTDMAMHTPVDFTNAQRMLGASPALLEGKILRGGMGTRMPMWGSIFTDGQIWDLVAYLYSLQFEYQ